MRFRSVAKTSARLINFLSRKLRPYKQIDLARPYAVSRQQSKRYSDSFWWAGAAFQQERRKRFLVARSEGSDLSQYRKRSRQSRCHANCVIWSGQNLKLG